LKLFISLLFDFVGQSLNIKMTNPKVGHFD